MADISFPADLAENPTARLRQRVHRAAGRLAKAFVSYEVATYLLATVQAAGLTIPTMVDDAPASQAAICRQHLRATVEAGQRLRDANPTARVTMRKISRSLGESPTCPSGGIYEIVPAGQTVTTDTGMSVLIPDRRVAARCVRPNGTECHPGTVLSLGGNR